MHPYRELPAVAIAELDDDGAHLAFIVLAVTGFVAMIALPVTRSGLFGASCTYAAVDWLVRHRRR